MVIKLIGPFRQPPLQKISQLRLTTHGLTMCAVQSGKCNLFGITNILITWVIENDRQPFNIFNDLGNDPIKKRETTRYFRDEEMQNR